MALGALLARAVRPIAQTLQGLGEAIGAPAEQTRAAKAARPSLTWLTSTSSANWMVLPMVPMVSTDVALRPCGACALPSDSARLPVSS
jgi:hypothetical protein